MSSSTPAADPPPLTVTGSRLLTAWMITAKVSFAFTTYQAGKLFLVGLGPDQRLSIFERTFPRPMGLGAASRRLWMAALSQLWRFEDFLDPGQTHEGHDALYVPLSAHTTGDIDIHDIHADADGQPIFVATRFNCLATIDPIHSFRPVWLPPWIDRLAGEDRCHLNGLAMRDGRPGWVTSVGTGSIVDSWRDHRRDGGVVVDVPSSEIVASGLSMPHSPRSHGGRLWLLQAGTGELGWIDQETGRFEPVCFLPGFARGLSIVGDHAIVGVSRPRENRTFGGLVLGERLERAGMEPECRICVVDLKTGDLAHSLTLEGVVEELYDVVALPGIIRPMALGFRTEEIRFAIRPGPSPKPHS